MTVGFKCWEEAHQVLGLAEAANRLVDDEDQPGLIIVLMLLEEKADALLSGIEAAGKGRRQEGVEVIVPDAQNLDAMLAEWRSARLAYSAWTSQEEPVETTRLDRLDAIETAIAAAPTNSIRDLAIKIIVADDHGDISSGGQQAHALFLEAWLIVHGNPWVAHPSSEI